MGPACEVVADHEEAEVLLEVLLVQDSLSAEVHGAYVEVVVQVDHDRGGMENQDVDLCGEDYHGAEVQGVHDDGVHQEEEECCSSLQEEVYPMHAPA